MLTHRTFLYQSLVHLPISLYWMLTAACEYSGLTQIINLPRTPRANILKVCLFFTVLAGLGISEAYFLNREDKNAIATAHPMGVARATGRGRRNDSVELAEQLLSESPAGRN